MNQKPEIEPSLLPIEKSTPAIQACEPRYALSVSLVNELLSPCLDLASPLGPEPALQEFDSSLSPGLAVLPRADSLAAPLVGPVLPSSGTNPIVQAQDADDSLIAQASRVDDAYGLTGSGQTIAVIDTGVAYDHLGLGGGFGPGYRVVGGWDFAENDADPYDDAPAGYHGSHVAGLVGGSGTFTDGTPFRGVAPGADLVALRVFDDAGNSDLRDVESALQWVHDNQDEFDSPITTVNLSLGTQLNDGNRDAALSLLEDELQALYEDDILVFAAAGNGQQSWQAGEDQLLYPASSSWATAVGSIDASGNLSDFSQFNDGILVAPGEFQVSSVPEHVQGWDGYLNDFSSLSGTSMASPQVAGAAAIVREALSQAGMDASNDAVLARLQDTAQDRTDPVSGTHYRILDLEAAVAFLNDSSNDSQDSVDESNDNDQGEAAGTVTTIDQYTGTFGGDEIVLDLRGLTDSSIAGQYSAASDSSGVFLSGVDGDFEVDFSSSDSSSPIVIDGLGGGDTLRILGSSHGEQLLLRPPSLSDAGASHLTFPGGTIEIRGFESVTMVGGGGEDRATLYDSSGDDELRSGPEAASLQGIGFEFNVEGFNKIYAHATAGGNDTAHLTDSEADDQLVIRPQFSSLRGGGRFQAAFGFERVHAYAENGGFDKADLGDSEANDVMSVSQSRSLISGAGYRASAIGFESVVATASQGGNDTVRIYVDDPSGTWHTTDSLTQWNGADGTQRIARGFEQSEAFEQFQAVEVGRQSLIESAEPVEPGSSEVSWQQIEEDVQSQLAALEQLFEELGDEE